MQSIFKPAVKLMNKLKYPRKFALIFILFLIPVTALLAFTIKSLNDDVTTSINQRNGLEYNIAVRSLIQHIQQHRGLSSVYLGGQTEVKDKITLKEKDIQEDIKKIDELDTLYGNQLNTTAEWSSLKGEWDNLKNQVFNLALKDSTERHTALISRLLNFTSNVADTSGLILTNKLDSFYLVDTIINKLPHTTEYMGQARATGAGVAGKKAMTKDERFKLLYLTQSITETLASTDRGMNIVYNNHPGLKSQLGSTTAKAMESSRKLVETIGSELLNKENITLDSDQYYSYATGVIDDIYALINQESAALTEIEGQQSNQALFMRNLVIGLASLILLSVLYLFVGFYMAVIDTIRVIEGSAAKIAEGDLSLRISHSIKDETKSILDSLNKVAEAFAGTVIASKGVANEVAIASEGLSAITEQVAEAANQVTQSIQEVAEGSESQLQGTEGVAAVIDEIARGIQAIAENSTSVSEAARKMELEAEAGNESISGAIIKMNVINASVKESNDTILSLGERSQSIGQIIESITNIASQTNLLALNAAIEAARAGEHGRGFAVVADEVRKLAEQSSQSANQITEIIKGIQGDTESSVKKMNRVTAVVREGITAVDEAGRIFERILSSTKSVSGQIEEVCAASEEISASSEEVAASVTEVSKIARESSAGAQNVAAASEEQLASMQEVSSSAISLLKKSEELNKIIERFKV